MAYPINRPINEERLTVQTTSIGGTPVAVYVGAPCKGYITKLSLVAQGTITTADCAIAVAINGTANASCAFTLPVAGAAAGQIATIAPVGVYVNEDDVIKFTPSGASGASIGGLFMVYVREQ